MSIFIRRTTPSDFKSVWAIYEYARQQMKLNGNPNQWKDDRPTKTAVLADIEHGNSYVIEKNGAVCGVFAFLLGEEPTYREIQGEWKNDSAYGTIHRIASDGSVKGVFRLCLDFCEKQISNIRIDTHEDNKIMRHLLETNGFERCGIIFVDDGTPRIAFQKTRHSGIEPE